LEYPAIDLNAAPERPIRVEPGCHDLAQPSRRILKHLGRIGRRSRSDEQEVPVTGASEDARPQSGKFSRRSLIASSAGVATTVAVTAVAPAAAVAAAHDAPAAPVGPPSTPIPAHPVVAFVHDAARGEVTVVSGAAERTFRDPALVKRLLAAANSRHMQSTEVK
jgi:hypothetical protein